MELNVKLPGEIRALFELAGGEEIRYCSPFDINSSGKYCDFSYGVLTNRRLLIIEEGRIVYEMQLSGLSAMKCESQVNNGILVVTEKESGLARHVARFSMKHISRFASIAKGGMLMLEGSDRIIENREYEKTCPICGRALPRTRVCPKCEGKNVTLLKFVRLCTNYKKQFVMVALMMLFSSLVGLAGPMFQQRFIDNTLMSDHGSFQEVIRFTLIMAVITVLSIITRYLRSLWSAKLGAGISMDIRGRLYQKRQVLTLSFIQDRRPGELMNRINNDSANIRKFMEDAFGSIFYLIVLMTGAIIVMLTISPGLTLLSIVFLPLAVAVVTGIIERKRGAGLNGLLAQTEGQAAVSPAEAAAAEAASELARPRLFFFNVFLTIAVIALLILDIFPSYVPFMMGVALAILVNYPGAKMQKKIINLHAGPALMMCSTLMGAAVLMGVLVKNVEGKEGAIPCMPGLFSGFLPAVLGRHLPLVIGILSVPLALAFDTDSYFYGMLPVMIGIGEGFGIAATPIAVAMVVCRNCATFISPMVPATLLGVGLADVDIKDHIKNSFLWVWGFSFICMIVAVLFGIMPL